MLVVEVSVTGPVPKTFEYFMNGFWYGVSAHLVLVLMKWKQHWCTGAIHMDTVHYSHAEKSRSENREMDAFMIAEAALDCG